MKWGLGKWRLTRRELEIVEDEIERTILLDMLARARDRLLSTAVSSALTVYLWVQIADLAEDTSRAQWRNVYAAAICGAVSITSIYLAAKAGVRALELKAFAAKRYRRIKENR